MVFRIIKDSRGAAAPLFLFAMGMVDPKAVIRQKVVWEDYLIM